MLAMGRSVAKARLDLMYFPATYTFYPVWGVPRLVVTMHDTLPLEHPELVFPTRRGRAAWLLKEYVAVRTADRIVTVSETSKRFLKKRYRLSDDRVRVVGEGPDPIFRPMGDDPRAEAVLARYGVSNSGRFLLYVGGLSPHKNLLRLIEGFARSAPADVSLVLVGDFNDVFHTHVPEIRRTIAAHALESRVILTGFVPDADLVFLYSRATRWRSPRCWRASGCRPSRRWPAEHPSRPAGRGRSQRSSATPASSSTRSTWTRSAGRWRRSSTTRPSATASPPSPSADRPGSTGGARRTTCSGASRSFRLREPPHAGPRRTSRGRNASRR